MNPVRAAGATVLIAMLCSCGAFQNEPFTVEIDVSTTTGVAATASPATTSPEPGTTTTTTVAGRPGGDHPGKPDKPPKP